MGRAASDLVGQLFSGGRVEGTSALLADASGRRRGRGRARGGDGDFPERARLTGAAFSAEQMRSFPTNRVLPHLLRLGNCAFFSLQSDAFV